MEMRSKNAMIHVTEMVMIVLMYVMNYNHKKNVPVQRACTQQKRAFFVESTRRIDH